MVSWGLLRRRPEARRSDAPAGAIRGGATTVHVEATGIASVHLTLAMVDYEHVREIAQGLVRADGITLTPLIFPSIEEITFRFTRGLEWDVSELSFGKYISLVSQGAAPSAFRNGRRPPASTCAAFWRRIKASTSPRSAGCRRG